MVDRASVLVRAATTGDLTALVRRGRTSAMAICPRDWHAKHDILSARGYLEGNTWMLKS